MALRFVDGFDHYADADITQKWTTNASMSVSSGSGRRGSNALSYSAGSARNVVKTLDAQGTWVIGSAWKFSVFSTGTIELMSLLDAGTRQCELRLNTDGTLSITRNGTVLGTTSFAISTEEYFYIEFKVFIHDTSGTAEVKVNGDSKLALSGVDTKNTANASANQVRIGHGSAVAGSPSALIDDIYICDGTGSTNNDFLGDCRVDAYLPSGNGNSSQLVGSDADSIDNYLHVDESAPDGDTSYVESATAGQKDTYAMADMVHTPSSIFGVQVLASAKKDDAGSRSIATVTRSGAADYDGASQGLSTSYAYYSDIREQDPATAAAWTKTGFNAAEMGVKVAA